ncbi:MAG: hypothetical protein MKZ80_00020 [Candidatus Nitrosopelagicus sp.]|nr:hypothetical protein [Candidatus Nitrosopelagicus sp.]|tara:strand:+ start:606 stop:1112 length:507 start_codon:yes stop_codon:yes gene_type:complete
MANKPKFLVIVGIFIGIGAALLFYGSQSITADIVIIEGQIDETNTVRIDAFLDPKINTEGVFAVQTLEENQQSISAVVLGPSGTPIVESTINQSSFEEIFEISEIGTYTLVIETDSGEMINVVGGIGHVPDSSAYSISTAGFFILLLGMIGVIVLGMLLVRERRRKSS